MKKETTELKKQRADLENATANCHDIKTEVVNGLLAIDKEQDRLVEEAFDNADDPRIVRKSLGRFNMLELVEGELIKKAKLKATRAGDFVMCARERNDAVAVLLKFRQERLVA